MAKKIVAVFVVVVLVATTSSFNFSLNRETILIVQNLRRTPVENIVLSKVDPFDFEAGSGPVEKFKGATIPARRTLKRELQINQFASRCPLTMELQFSDGEKAKFSLNMKYAIGDGDAEFGTEGPFKINYQKTGNIITVTVEEK